LTIFLVFLRSAYFELLAGTDGFLPFRLAMIRSSLFLQACTRRTLDARREQQQLDCMPKRKEPPLPPKEQFKRFVETAITPQD
jgi:hypothetical protein